MEQASAPTAEAALRAVYPCVGYGESSRPRHQVFGDLTICSCGRAHEQGLETRGAIAEVRVKLDGSDCCRTGGCGNRCADNVRHPRMAKIDNCECLALLPGGTKPAECHPSGQQQAGRMHRNPRQLHHGGLNCIKSCTGPCSVARPVAGRHADLPLPFPNAIVLVICSDIGAGPACAPTESESDAGSRRHCPHGYRWRCESCCNQMLADCRLRLANSIQGCGIMTDVGAIGTAAVVSKSNVMQPDRTTCLLAG